MKLSIKTLNGELFSIDVDENENVGDVKSKIQSVKSSLVMDRQKLIHAGKILKDEQSLKDLGLKESDFIVCMLTKEVVKKPTPNPTVVEPTVVAPPVVQPVAEVIAPNTVDKVEPQTVTSDSSFPFKESLQSLVSMGFPEQECKAALTASNGNPDLAYEFLLTGIPERREVPRSVVARVDAIEQLRQHPQLNMLKQLVQQNPAALSQVLDLIGQQNPALLAAIHENNEAFIALMNEPITETPLPQQIPQANRNPPQMPQHHDHGDPSQMIQLLSSLPQAQRAQFAQSMGMSPEQLEGFMTMISSMPPEDLRNIFGGGGATGPEPSNVIRLTEEEMAAVNRLVELGFSQQQAAQAYLACNKNEAVAANLLLEGGWADDDADDVNDDDMYN